MLVASQKVDGHVKPLVRLWPFDYFCWDKTNHHY